MAFRLYIEMFIDKLLFRVFSYLVYYWRAQSNLYIHSPFVFDFLNQVNANRHLPILEMNNYRAILAQDSSDFSYITNDRTITTTTANRYHRTSISDRYGRILMTAAKQVKANNFLELGTSLGVSTAYLFFSLPTIHGITIDSNTHAIIKTKAFFDTQFSNHNIKFINETFDAVLTPKLKEIQNLDFAFIDGDHRNESTLRYVKTILPYLSENAAIVLDDIRWSKDMYKTWSELIELPEFNYTIDFGRIGILYKINNHSHKQHFYLH